MLKILFAPLRLLIKLIFLLIFFFSLVFALIQTKWVQEAIQKKAVQLLDDLGIQITLKGLSGTLPFSWKIDQAIVFTNPHESWNLQAIKLRFAISPLIKGQIVIDYLHIEKINCSFTKNIPSSSLLEDETRIQLRKVLEKLSFPIPIRLKHAYIADFFCPSIYPTHLAIQAKGMLKNANKFFLDSSVLSLVESTETFHITLAGNKRRNQINAYIKLQIPQFEQKLLAEMSLKGLWSSWVSLIYDSSPTALPIQGFIKAHLVPQSLSQEKCPAPFLWDWKCACVFLIPKLDTLSINNLHIYSALLDVRGKAVLHSDLNTSWLQVDFSSEDLSLLNTYCKYPIQGFLQGHASFDTGNFSANFIVPQGSFNDIDLSDLKGSIEGRVRQGSILAETDLSLILGKFPFRAEALLEYTPSKELFIDRALFTGASTKFEGSVSWNLAENALDGSIFANSDQLANLASFVSYDVDGNCALECRFSHANQIQAATISASASRFRFQNYYANELLYSAELYTPFSDIQGNMQLVAHQARTLLGSLDLLEIKTHSEDGIWPFTMETRGDIQGSFSCEAQGSCQFNTNFVTFECLGIRGELLDIAFILRYPFRLEIYPSSYILSPVSLSVGDGDFYASCEISKTHLLGKCDIAHFPLKFVSPLMRNISLRGNLSMNSFVDSNLDNTEGVCNLVIETAELLQEDDEAPILAKGSLQAHLHQNKVQFVTELRTKQEEMMDFSGSLPIKYSFLPFKVQIDENSPLSLELIAEGKLENIFDFIQLGSHYASGLVSTRIFLSQTLLSPRIQGSLDWQLGKYENYYTGTSLRDIQAKVTAENDLLNLKSFTAYDLDGGVITAMGHLALDFHQHLPFSLEAKLRHTHLLRVPIFDSTFTGNVIITGNRSGGLAKGAVYIDEATVEIPDKLSTEVPPLPIKFIHMPSSVISYTFDAKPLFPIKLDFDLTAEDKIFVRGKGVNSEWKGKVKLIGDNAHIIPEGTLSLIKGEYLFSGKIFKLTEGQIVFNDIDKFSSYLQLSGQLTLPDVVITAQLNGPLQSPQLTFQSNPQLPTSSILSRVLFDKDITDISQSEASKLANALMAISSSAGPDILDTIRKTIGVDRLNLVSSSSGSTEEVALQIGKYLTKGVLVTLSQSTTSSHVIVEIEIPYGFVLQAETQEEKEGKFSLKWTKSY